jgi:hypothetical protein
MKKFAATFLQAFLVLLGAGALVFMLWEPHLEGRNAHATAMEIYFNDPFLAFAYIGSIPFFIGLYQAFKVAGYLGQGTLFSLPTIKALGTIKFCAWATIGFVAVGEIILLMQESDDRAGGVVMGLVIMAASVIVGVMAARFQRGVRNSLKRL